MTICSAFLWIIGAGLAMGFLLPLFAQSPALILPALLLPFFVKFLIPGK